jgi:hypothetical protein
MPAKAAWIFMRRHSHASVRQENWRAPGHWRANRNRRFALDQCGRSVKALQPLTSFAIAKTVMSQHLTVQAELTSRIAATVESDYRNCQHIASETTKIRRFPFSLLSLSVLTSAGLRLAFRRSSCRLAKRDGQTLGYHHVTSSHNRADRAGSDPARSELTRPQLGRCDPMSRLTIN